MRDQAAQRPSISGGFFEAKMEDPRSIYTYENTGRSFAGVTDDNALLETRVGVHDGQEDVEQDPLDEIVADLLRTETELEETKTELRQKEEELLALQQDITRLLERDKDSTARLREMQQKLADAEVRANAASTAVEGRQMGTMNTDHLSKEILSLQTHVQQLRITSKEKDTAVAQLQVEKRVVEQEAEQLKNQLKVRDQGFGQGAIGVQQPTAAHVSELEELRRVSDFFKKTSESLSTETKELKATNRGLQESLGVKDRALKEKESLIGSLYDDIARLQGQQSHRF